MNPNHGIAARRTGWIALLTAAVIVFTFAFACVTLFPALAALDRRRDALALTGANQAIGYGLLGYLQTWDSFAWGGVIGSSAFAATAAAFGAEAFTCRAGSLKPATAE